MSAWPSLRVDEWTETREALHLWTQVTGKIKLAKTPLVNHWWNVTFVVSPTGLSSGAVPDGDGLFQIDFDFIDSQLQIVNLDGQHANVPLRSMAVADFYAETLAALARLGVVAEIWPVPVEIPGEVIAFDADHRVRSYEPEQALTFWRQLVQANRVLAEFRAGFVGKDSPVHFFWGSFDLAVTRFSGRSAPPHPGGFPNCPDWVMAEAYSREVSSAGFWPGGGEEGAFYSYAYPEPPGFAEQPIRPPEAAYSEQFRQFLLPYEAVRTAEDPDATLLAFLEDTYEAAARLADWDPALAVAPRARA